MIHFNNISLSFAGQTIFRKLNWFVKSGKRIGLIGANGAGKTTLLRVLTGQQLVDEGEVIMAGHLTLGYLEQEIQEALTDRSVLQEAMQAFDRVFDLERKIEVLTAELVQADPQAPNYLKKIEQIEHYQTALQGLEAHRIEDQSATMLMGLGFTAEELDRPLSTFSGGWRMRVALAKMLLKKPDILLLDEPTNHLDIESIGWLEAYLKSYRGTVILVSHDRYFLDRMVDTIAALSYGAVTEYAGNYAYYLEERAARRVLQQAAFENQQKEIKETERFIERFRYKATKAKQVQSRVKALERLDVLEAPEAEEASVSFRFPEPEASGRMVLEMTNFSKTYPTPEGGTKVVFDHAPALNIERGDKIALVGKNGAGKSTLARILLGTEPFEGTRSLGYKVQLTYFAQHQAESLNPKHSILEAIYEAAQGETETQIRALLGAFLFTGDDVYKPISVLSGGERSRVALARTLLKPANFLILDEPTNHLDMASIAVLIEALKQYAGTFVVVSHDRHFLDQIVNKVWYVADRQVRSYLGNYADYEWKRQQEHLVAKSIPKASPALVPETNVEAPKKAKDQKRAEAEARNAFYRQMKEANGDYSQIDWAAMEPAFIQKGLEKIEVDLAEMEAKQAQLEAQLNDPRLYEDLDQAQALNEAYQTLQVEMLKQYEWWEILSAL